MLIFALSSVLLSITTRAVEAQVTVYGQTPLAHQSTSVAAGEAPLPTLAAYDGLVLTPPTPPTPPVTALALEVARDAATVPGLSIPHTRAGFFGFSVEMSVITQTIGKNSSHLFVPFLNLMSNLQERSGSILIRLGGNTQEYAKFTTEVFEDGRITHKEDSGTTQTTETPAVLYTMDLFYMAANISSLVNVDWFLGLPFNDTSTFHLEIGELGQAILGDHLVALQAGNEPDLYGPHNKRPVPYLPVDYSAELDRLFDVVDTNDRLPIKNKFVAPSISASQPEWTPELVWETGFIDAFKDRLYALTVERYPDNNCFATFGVGRYYDPQENFHTFLTHQTVVEFVGYYGESTRLAQEAGLPFIMFETNTGSCGGFPGISQSYGASLWILDYGFQMANYNFSNALLHIGGQNVYYNPWISPPTNQSNFNEWTVGSVFYSAMIIAEAFGKSGTARVVDLQSPSPFTPSYAIYEQGTLSKFALFNYIDDPSGANNVNASITVTGGVPATVRVKYYRAESVSSKTDLTWAGQTFGNNFEADGRLKGDLSIETITCDTTANVCNIPLRAPSFALVFMDSSSESLSVGQATATFATTAHTRARNTATIDPAVLATSNGHSGLDRQHMGSTSHGSVSAASRQYELVSVFMVLVSAVVGGFIVGSGLTR
ncbi:hypothetical protein H1R20_g3144, partial [Candolleomyces eurysporus]